LGCQALLGKFFKKFFGGESATKISGVPAKRKILAWRPGTRGSKEKAREVQAWPGVKRPELDTTLLPRSTRVVASSHLFTLLL